MSWPGIEPASWEASTLAMSYSNSLIIAIRNIYMISRQIKERLAYL
jgi:hypothetical protein